MDKLSFPPWLGVVPGWGLLLVVLVTLIKTWPIIQRNLLEAREKRESRYGERIKDLEKAVRDCQQECEHHKDEMRNEIAVLREKHMSEQLALVRTIVTIFPDAPQLQLLLRALETGKRSMEYLGEVTGDAHNEPKD